VIVDALVTAFHAVWLPGAPATISVYFHERGPASLDLKALIAAHAIPLNEVTAVEFMKIHCQLREIEVMLSPHEATAAKQKLKEAMIQLLQAAPWENAKPLPPEKQRLVEQAMAGQGDLARSSQPALSTHDHHDPPNPAQAAV